MTARCAPLLMVMLAVVLVFEAAALAKTAIVYRTDRTAPMRGELVAEGPDQVVLRIANIETTIPRRLIRRIEFELTVPEQYAQRIADLEADDHEGKYNAIKWLYGLNTLEADKLAKGELDKLIKAKPDHQQARLLRELIQQRIKAREAEQDNGGQTTTDPTKDPTPPTDTTKPGKAKVLDKDQVNLMKVIEIIIDDKPRIAINNRDLNKFYEEYREHAAMSEYQGRSGRSKFMRLDGYRIMDLIFKMGATKWYSKVNVLDEPKPLQTYRQNYAAGLVARHCGSCHGGGKAKGLYIVTERAASIETAYTNLLIMHRTNIKDLKVIDRAVPDESLLLQYALPREDARYPHPEVKGFRQFFTGKDDKRFAEAVAWVRSLYPKAQYPIQYTIPATVGSDKPAAETPADETPAKGAPATDG